MMLVVALLVMAVRPAPAEADILTALAIAGAVAAVVVLVVFLVVRGLPAWLLSRHVLPEPSRRALALLSATQLPLIVAITTLGLQQQQMRPSTAAAMVGAGMLSVFVFPLLALTLVRPRQIPSGVEGASASV